VPLQGRTYVLCRIRSRTRFFKFSHRALSPRGGANACCSEGIAATLRLHGLAKSLAALAVIALQLRQCHRLFAASHRSRWVGWRTCTPQCTPASPCGRFATNGLQSPVATRSARLLQWTLCRHRVQCSLVWLCCTSSCPACSSCFFSLGPLRRVCGNRCTRGSSPAAME